MRYKILKGGKPVNEIIASERFVADYCAKHGYTYEEEPVPDPPPAPDPAPTTEDRVAALEAENKTLKAQVSALTDQNDFQEELIVELAGVVYA